MKTTIKRYLRGSDYSLDCVKRGKQYNLFVYSGFLSAQINLEQLLKYTFLKVERLERKESDNFITYKITV